MSQSEILEDIRDRVGRANLFNGNSFKRGRCSADLTGISEDDRVVVDLDKIFPVGQQGKNQCECVLFYFDDTGNLVVVPIELKGGDSVDASEAAAQLKGGAAFAINYTPRGVKSICGPILFCRSISTAEVKQLKKPQSKVPFGGKPFEIKTTRCGNKLAAGCIASHSLIQIKNAQDSRKFRRNAFERTLLLCQSFEVRVECYCLRKRVYRFL